MISNAVSLFAGVGGFDLALERNGIEVIATSEIDAAARGVLEYHFDLTQHFGDVHNITPEILIDCGFEPTEGIITGGFPCQPFSIAGRREGTRDPRGTLFWEIMRLAEGTEAGHLLLENVPGLLTIDGGWTFKAMLNLMQEAGYVLDFDILDAQFFGVPQRRKRLFIVAKRIDLIEPDDPWLDTQRLINEYLLTPSWERLERLLTDAEWLLHPVLPYTPDKWVIPYTAHIILKEYLRHARTASGEVLGEAPDTNKRRALLRQAKELSTSLYDLADLISATEVLPDPAGGGGDQGAGFATLEEAAAAVGHGTDEGVLVPLRSPVSTLQGGGRRGYRIDAEGAAGGHLVPFIKTIRSGARDAEGNLPPEVWAEQDVAPTLNVFDNSGHSRATVLNVADDLRVRRLTPLECERLQGFPDDWTRWRVEGEGLSRKVVEQKDSRRFQQMGNAVAVPVAQWVLNRISG